MADQWFYVEEGESVGPLSTAELGARIAAAKGGSHLVWAPGMSEWVDARTLPQFSQPQRGDKTRGPGKLFGSLPNWANRPALLQRARHEFLAYLAISAYLLVWFSALMFYKASVLRGVGVEFAPFGIAAVKALILGKFILVLEAVKLGAKERGQTLAVQILKRALLFTLALVVMSIVEEIVVGHFHGRDARQTLSEIAGGTNTQIFAASILMFLVLVPYLAFRRLAAEFGELPELLFARREPRRER